MDCKSCKRNGKVFDDDLDKARLTKINRRLVAAVVIIALFAITAIVVNNIVWLHKWTQFDTVSYSRDYSRDYSQGTWDTVNKIEDIIREAPDEQTRQELQRIAGRMRNG
jgi:hypothetical protein